jgi:predicted nucleic acid-binding protein
MLVEASSVLHEMAWRKEISAERSRTMLDRLLEAPVEVRTPDGLIEAAWYVADELGWTKTYDAQYVARANTRVQAGER